MAVNTIPRNTSPISEIVDKLAQGVAGDFLPVRVKKGSLTAVTSNAVGGLFTFQNPESVAVLAAILLNITTAATTTTVTTDIGRAGSATGDADDLIDGRVLGPAGVPSSFIDGGTNGLGFVQLDANGGTNDWIVGKASASAAGLVGKFYVVYIPIS